MLLSEILEINQSIAGQLSKVEAEIVAKFADLQAAIDNLTTQLADAPLSEAQADSVNELLAAAQRLDDLTPDAVVDEPEVPVVE